MYGIPLKRSILPPDSCRRAVQTPGMNYVWTIWRISLFYCLKDTSLVCINKRVMILSLVMHPFTLNYPVMKMRSLAVWKEPPNNREEMCYWWRWSGEKSTFSIPADSEQKKGTSLPPYIISLKLHCHPRGFYTNQFKNMGWVLWWRNYLYHYTAFKWRYLRSVQQQFCGFWKERGSGVPQKRYTDKLS